MVYVGMSGYNEEQFHDILEVGSTTYYFDILFENKKNHINCLMNNNQDTWAISNMSVKCFNKDEYQGSFYFEFDYQPRVEEEDPILIETIRILPSYYSEGIIVWEYYRPHLYGDGFHKETNEYQNRGMIKNRYLHFSRPGGYYRYDFNTEQKQYIDCYGIVCPRNLPDEQELKLLVDQIPTFNRLGNTFLKCKKLQKCKQELLKRKDFEEETKELNHFLQLICKERLAKLPQIGYNGTNETTRKQTSIFSTD